jgi:hypothetical protein
MKTAKTLFKEARAQGFAWVQAAETAYFTQNPGAQLVRFTSLYQLLTTSFSFRMSPEGTQFWLNAIHELNGRNFGRDFQPKSKPSDFSSENKRREFQIFTEKEYQNEL